MQSSQAIILAGGLGTRLRSAVPDLPKCMAPVAGKPFLFYVIEHFQKQGITEFIFSIGYLHEVIEEWLQKEYSSLSYQCSIEENPLGTGGAIKRACSLANTKTVIVSNGDTLFKVNFNKLLSFYHMCGADCALTLKPMKNFDRYGVVELKNDYSIKSFHEKKHYNQGLINGGLYALNKGKFLAEGLPEKFSFEKDYLEKFYKERKMFGVVQDEYFIDIGIPEDFERAQTELKT
ncbi:MAG TPA: nucleotidyltransferase family protein [Saprospiraceae bacterium]|nr:nucleotidyltransferase family protein [Saprospiraceae bacterium]